MKKYINLIISCVSLVVTGTLLIVVMFAWYVVNKEATATGIQASIVARSNIVTGYKVYSFSNVTTSGNITTYTITTPKDFRYNPDFDKSPTAKLIEIDFVSPAADVTHISMNSSARYFPGYPNQANPGYITSTSNLSISGVIKFTMVSNVTFSNGYTETSGTVSLTTPSSYSNYNYNDSTGAITNPTVDLSNTTITNVTKLFILVDFDPTSIEKLFSNNIGNPIVDAEELTYLTDFKIQILGSVVSE